MKAAITLMVLAITIPVMAAPVATDFDDLTLGAIAGQEGWFGPGTVQNTTVVSGQAVTVTGGGFGHAGIWDPPAVATLQSLRFDIRLDKVIGDVPLADAANIQQTVLLRGPDANTNNQAYFVYKGAKNAGTPPGPKGFEIRGSSGTNISPEAERDVWYTVLVDYDLAAGSWDVEMLREGAAWWDPAAVTGWNNGNTNLFYVEGGPSAANGNIHFDNFNEVGQTGDGPGAIPEPATMALIGLGGLVALRRRRR